MILKSKIVEKNSNIYKYMERTRDIIKVFVDIEDDDIDTYDIENNAKNDYFQLINNVELLLPRIQDKLIDLKQSNSLIVYIEDYNDKYIFTTDKKRVH